MSVYFSVHRQICEDFMSTLTAFNLHYMTDSKTEPSDFQLGNVSNFVTI